MKLMRRLILDLFSNESSVVILFGMSLLGCAGTTTVQRQHHLLLENSSKASVCFLRPKEGFMGVRGKPIGIKIDGENLLDLSIGQYTFLDIKPGMYDMVVTSSTIEGPDNAMVETSRDFVLDFGDTDSLYLLFKLEKIDLWKILGQKLAEQVDKAGQRIAEETDTITIALGRHVSLRFSSERQQQLASEERPQSGIGYMVESVSRQSALQTASKLELVEVPRDSLIHK